MQVANLKKSNASSMRVDAERVDFVALDVGEYE